jgi:hypothetical protein
MAKKVRSRPEDTAESRFEFPVFDERAFIVHELELTLATIFSVVIAVLAGVLSAILTIYGGAALTLAAPVAVGLVVIIFSPFLLRFLRPQANEYTRGDWAGVILLELFGWLGIWFLLAGVYGTH